jgi:hypothetical protein
MGESSAVIASLPANSAHIFATPAPKRRLGRLLYCTESDPQRTGIRVTTFIDYHAVGAPDLRSAQRKAKPFVSLVVRATKACRINA